MSQILRIEANGWQGVRGENRAIRAKPDRESEITGLARKGQQDSALADFRKTK